MCRDKRLLLAPGLAIVIMLTAAAPHASAEVIAIPLTAFTGSERVADFTVGSTQPLPYSEDGATFLSYTGFFASIIGGNAFLALGGSGTLTVLFNDPVSMAGFNFMNQFGPAVISAEAFADLQGGRSLGQASLASFAPLQSGFVGFAADSLFSRAEIAFAVPGPMASFVLDDFRFDPVPEPGTITLTLIGLGWLGSRMRRRTRSAGQGE